jgi:hypothetical protein
MALIYRALFEVAERDFPEKAPALAQDWVRWKLRREDLDTTGTGSLDDGNGVEMRWYSAEEDALHAYRLVLYEDRRADGEQVRTTFTAFADGEPAWAWVDVERWTTSPEARGWLPFTPSLVNQILESLPSARSGLTLAKDAQIIDGQEAAVALVRRITDDRRDIPIVVVTPSQREEEPLAPASARATELARRLGGIALVYTVAPGSVSPFSKAALETLGEGMDVYAGSIRTYLPGAGGRRDRPTRHRILAFRKIEGRPADFAARIIVPPLLRRAAEIAPPELWRKRVRGLIDASMRGGAGSDEILALADEEIERLTEELNNSMSDQRELQEEYDELTADMNELLGTLDDLRGEARYLRSKLAEHDAAAAYAQAERDEFLPEWCSDVVVEARRRLELVVLHESVDDGAADLDEHMNESWARRAWSAFEALQAYAEAKRDEQFNGDFMTFCSQSRTNAVIPTSWVGRHESETTRNNPRFRELRVLPISSEVASDGRILMEEHIRIEKGGSPSPRIHFYDDTKGRTGKIHVGWFGDHLDSFAKT